MNNPSASSPLLSVNIVTRNRREALEKAIRSVDSQTYRPIEIVVVDNDSADGSADMVEANWPDARVIRLHRNIGCQPGRNIGMKNCRGKYIFNLDDDGWLHPEAIEKIVAKLEQNPKVGLIMAAVLSPDDVSVPEDAYASCAGERLLGNFVGAAHAIRAALLQEVGYFPEYVRGGSEVNLSLRLIDAGYELLYLPQAVMHHELSNIERDNNIHRFYHVWHTLENVLRLYPLREVPLNCLWKALIHGYSAIRMGTFRGYCAGLIRFCYEVPFILRERKPVKKWAVQKQRYLMSRIVTSFEESMNFKSYSLWQSTRDRIKGWIR